jgi:hypothetical protein
MTHWSLCDELTRAASEMAGVRALPSNELSDLAHRFTQRFITDPTASWWWGAIQPEMETTEVPYDGPEPWNLILELVPNRREYVVLVTDEKPWPSCAFAGELAPLIALLASAPFFEYVVTDEEASFALFDTHHNSLVSVTGFDDGRP